MPEILSFRQILRESNQPKIDSATEIKLKNINYDNPGSAIKELIWLGAIIANEFAFCNAANSRNRLHEMKPQLYKEAVEDNRIKRIEIAANLYENAVLEFTANFNYKKAFSNLLDINIARNSAIKALSEGTKLANNKKDDNERREILSLISSLLSSINLAITLFNNLLVFDEDRRRVDIHNNDTEMTQKPRVLRPVKEINESEIGL